MNQILLTNPASFGFQPVHEDPLLEDLRVLAKTNDKLYLAAVNRFIDILEGLEEESPEGPNDVCVYVDFLPRSMFAEEEKMNAALISTISFIPIIGTVYSVWQVIDYVISSVDSAVNSYLNESVADMAGVMETSLNLAGLEETPLAKVLNKINLLMTVLQIVSDLFYYSDEDWIQTVIVTLVGRDSLGTNFVFEFDEQGNQVTPAPGAQFIRATDYNVKVSKKHDERITYLVEQIRSNIQGKDVRYGSVDVVQDTVEIGGNQGG